MGLAGGVPYQNFGVYGCLASAGGTASAEAETRPETVPRGLRYPTCVWYLEAETENIGYLDPLGFHFSLSCACIRDGRLRGAGIWSAFVWFPPKARAHRPCPQDWACSPALQEGDFETLCRSSKWSLEQFRRAHCDKS